MEKVIPSVEIRQWVISFPLQILHYFQTHKILQSVLRIVVDEIRKRLIACGPDLPDPKIEAATFIHQFGKTDPTFPHSRS